MKTFIRNLLKKLILTLYRPILQDLDSINKNLNFLINHAVSMDQVKTLPSVKQYQIKEFDILEKVITFFQRHNISYFLYGGCLVGAIRHKGFVPWDDDIDIAILREDFNKLIEFESELQTYGLFLSSPFSQLQNFSGIGFDKIYEKEGHYSISVCVFDLVETQNINDVLKSRKTQNNKAIAIRNRYYKNMKKSGRGNSLKKLRKNLSKLDRFHLKNIVTTTKSNVSENTFIVKSVCSADRNAYMTYKSVFPLEKTDFFVHPDQKISKLNIPNNPDEYLINFYGKDYMFFPRDLYPTHINR